MMRYMTIDRWDVTELRQPDLGLMPRDIELLGGPDLLWEAQVKDILSRGLGLSRSDSIQDLMEDLTGAAPQRGWHKLLRGQAIEGDCWPASTVALALVIGGRLGAVVNGLDEVVDTICARLRRRRVLTDHELQLYQAEPGSRRPAVFVWSAGWLAGLTEGGAHDVPPDHRLMATRLQDDRTALLFRSARCELIEVVVRSGAGKLPELLMRHGCVDPVIFETAALQKLMADAAMAGSPLCFTAHEPAPPLPERHDGDKLH